MVNVKLNIRFRMVSFSVMGALFGIFPLPIIATQSTETPLVIGHKPTASNVSIDSQSLKLNDILSVNYDYNDLDGDLEGATSYKWYISEDKINKVEMTGGTGNGFIPTTAHWNKFVAVEVTPKEAPGYLIGEPVLSDFVGPIWGLVNNFLQMSNLTPWITHQDAKVFCLNQGMRVPTIAELVALYNENPSGQMKLVPGFNTNFFPWADEVSSRGVGMQVSLNNGRVSEALSVSSIGVVTCVR